MLQSDLTTQRELGLMGETIRPAIPVVIVTKTIMVCRKIPRLHQRVNLVCQNPKNRRTIQMKISIRSAMVQTAMMVSIRK